MSIDYNNKILSKIKEKSLLDNDKFNFLEKGLREPGADIDKIIKKASLLDSEEYTKIKAEVTNIPYKNLIDESIDEEVLKLLPPDLSRNYKMVLFNKVGNILEVGLVNPENFSAVEAAEFLAHKNNCNVKYYLISEESFEYVAKKLGNIAEEVGEVLGYAKEKLAKGEGEIEIEEAKLESDNFEEIIRSAPVSRIISVILKHAVEGRASDIHIEPVNKQSITRFRVDGKLHSSIVLPIYIHNALIARVKVMANMKIDETRIPQDGRIRVKIKKERVDLRVSTLPLIDYEKVVMRVLSTPKKIPSLEEIGFSGFLKDKIEENIKRPNGMILVTGPTGSGKSFTLFTFLNKINSEEINISTLEDPVEYNIVGVNQSQVRPEAKYTFASGLRSMLRQDPDVIMVGEIRDEETAELAIHAALTGHLVFSTLHTNSASAAIPRLIDMKIEPFLLASTLNMILAQRLVRTICDGCREEYKLPANLEDKIINRIESIPEKAFFGKIKKGDPIKFYHGKGCGRCGGTGYKGRAAITEVLVLNRELKNIISSGANMVKFEEELDRQGHIKMLEDGLIKTLNGTTTVEEVLRVTKET